MWVKYPDLVRRFRFESIAIKTSGAFDQQGKDYPKGTKLEAQCGYLMFDNQIWVKDNTSESKCELYYYYLLL